MNDRTDYPFSLTAAHIAELAVQPIGPNPLAPKHLHDMIVHDVKALLAEAEVADLNVYHASAAIDELVSVGFDLILAIRMMCNRILNIAEPPPTPVLPPDVNSLRPDLTNLSSLLAQIADGDS